MAGRFKTQKSTHHRETKPQNFHQELENSSCIKDSLSSKVTTNARWCLSHNEGVKRRSGRAPLDISNDKKHTKNECTLKDIIKHQMHFMGDNCNILKPVAKHLSNHEIKHKEVSPTISRQQFYISNKEILSKANIKVNTISKHTISNMDFLRKNTDNILRLLDEMEIPPLKTSSRKVRNNERTNKNSHQAQRVGKVIKVRKYNSRFVEALKTTEEEKSNVADECCCVETHRCLVSVESEDSLGGLVHDDDDDDDYAFQDELLTPQELSSVETGSDEDWLYKPTKNI